jgi:hypothetical protein
MSRAWMRERATAPTLVRVTDDAELSDASDCGRGVALHENAIRMWAKWATLPSGLAESFTHKECQKPQL